MIFEYELKGREIPCLSDNLDENNLDFLKKEMLFRCVKASGRNEKMHSLFKN